MLDIGWSELLLIGVVALIVVGPKDLPVMFRTLGRLTAKARQMAREFSRAMEDAARDTGVDGVAGDLKNLASKKSLGLEALERATEKFEKWDPKFPANRGADAARLQNDPNVAKNTDPDPAETDFEPEDLGPEPVSAPAPTPAPAPVPAPAVAPPPVADPEPEPRKAQADGKDAEKPAKPRKKSSAKKDEA